MVTSPFTFLRFNMPKVSRQRARAYPQPGRLVLGVLLDLSCKISALTGLVALVMFVLNKPQQEQPSPALSFWGSVLVVSVLAYFVFAAWRFFHARHTLCSLCRGPVFHSQKSAKSREATKYPGLSYGSSIALSLVFTGRYRCMYCGTPFRLKK